jgi:hypothetical protein
MGGLLTDSQLVTNQQIELDAQDAYVAYLKGAVTLIGGLPSSLLDYQMPRQATQLVRALLCALQ